MSGNKNWFSQLEEKFHHKVKHGNDTCIVVIRKGDAQMVVNGITYIISHVYYVSKLKNNLLTIGQLQKKGLTITT